MPDGSRERDLRISRPERGRQDDHDFAPPRIARTGRRARIGSGVANGTDWQGHLVFYRPLVLAVDLMAVILLTLLIGGCGILISFRSETVQGATQVLLGSFFMPITLRGFVGLLFWEQLRGFFSRLHLAPIGGAILDLIALVDIALLALVLGHFRRGRLLTR